MFCGSTSFPVYAHSKFERLEIQYVSCGVNRRHKGRIERVDRQVNRPRTGQVENRTLKTTGVRP